MSGEKLPKSVPAITRWLLITGFSAVFLVIVVPCLRDRLWRLTSTPSQRKTTAESNDSHQASGIHP